MCTRFKQEKVLPGCSVGYAINTGLSRRGPADFFQSDYNTDHVTMNSLPFLTYYLYREVDSTICPIKFTSGLKITV